MSDSTTTMASGAPPPLPRRLGRLGLVALQAVLLLTLVLAYDLPPLAALLALMAFVAGAALFPEPARVVALPGGGERPDTVAGLAAFADALSDPAFIVDSHSIVRHRNPAAQRQYPDLDTGAGLTLWLRTPDFLSALDRVNRTGAAHSVELHETVPSETWNKVTLAPLRLPGTEWGADPERLIAVTFQSLTELKRVDAMRTDFIANASHELRTPLTSLLGFIETLQGPAARDATARKKFLAIMRGQAERMARLIEDLLSLSRIEMYQHVRPTGSVDLALLLREVHEGLATHAAEAGVEIALTVESAPAMVAGDREQLYEVFENLIDNALKYGAAGKRVDVRLAPAGRPGFAQQVIVADHGPGDAEEHVPRLTERFYRIDAESSRRKKGTGLGLAIVKHIVQRHRGQLAIRSRPGEGLRVEVLLPV